MMYKFFFVVFLQLFVFVVGREAGIRKRKIENPSVESYLEYELRPKVELAERPRLSLESSHRVSEDRRYIILECGVFTVPVASIQWFHDGELVGNGQGDIDNNEEEMQLNVGHRTHQLNSLRSRLQVPCLDSSRIGTYSCVAKTEYHEKTATFDMDSMEVDGICEWAYVFGHKPFIATHTDMRVERERVSIQLQCRAAGIPLPKIEWIDDDTGDSLNPEDYVQLSNGDLLLVEPKASIGPKSFRCVASNRLGSDTSSRVLVLVALYDGEDDVP